MTLDSKQFEVWRRLGVRFLLEDQPPGIVGAGVTKTIQLISNADHLLVEIKGVSVTTAYTMGQSGSFTIAEVPEGKRWRIFAVAVSRTGDNRWDSVFYRDVSESVDVVFERTGDQTTFTSGLLGQPLPMDQGDLIRVGLDGNGVAGGNVVFNALIEEEDAY